MPIRRAGGQAVRVVQEIAGQLGLGGEQHLLRDPGQFAVLLIPSAPFGQVQSPADQGVATDVAKVNVTATWHSATPPTVPLYWRAAPAQSAEDFSSAVSSAISTASPSSRWLTAHAAAMSRICWSSQTARDSRCYSRCGPRCPAASAMVQQL